MISLFKKTLTAALIFVFVGSYQIMASENKKRPFDFDNDDKSSTYTNIEKQPLLEDDKNIQNKQGKALLNNLSRIIPLENKKRTHTAFSLTPGGSDSKPVSPVNFSSTDSNNKANLFAPNQSRSTTPTKALNPTNSFKNFRAVDKLIKPNRDEMNSPVSFENLNLHPQISKKNKAPNSVIIDMDKSLENEETNLFSDIKSDGTKKIMRFILNNQNKMLKNQKKLSKILVKTQENQKYNSKLITKNFRTNRDIITAGNCQQSAYCGMMIGSILGATLIVISTISYLESLL